MNSLERCRKLKGKASIDCKLKALKELNDRSIEIFLSPAEQFTTDLYQSIENLVDEIEKDLEKIGKSRKEAHDIIMKKLKK